MKHCNITDCTNLYNCKGYCSTHYRQMIINNQLVPTSSTARDRRSKTAEYRSWTSMRKRCYSPSSPSFKNYGGRGITICERWKSFDNFLSDMGNKPNINYSIDRIDVNGNYEPSNCRWATKHLQAINTTKSSNHPGVCWEKDRNKWVAMLKVNGKKVYRERFDNLEDAINGRQQAEIRFSISY